MTTDHDLRQVPTPVSMPAFARTVRGCGPGVVLAHGAGGSIEGNYGSVLGDLAADHTVVGVDYPGTGATPRSHVPLTADDLADQLVAAADAEGLHRFAIAGFSLGGPIAIRAATRHPDRVTALVLTAAFAYADARLRLAASTWRELYESGDLPLLAKFLTLVAFGRPFLEGLPEQQRAATLRGFVDTTPPGTPEHTDLVERIDVRDDLARLTIPTLVISTTADQLVSPDLQRQLAAGIPRARLIDIDTGHLPFAERPAEWRGLMTAFLAAHRQAV